MKKRGVYKSGVPNLPQLRVLDFRPLIELEQQSRGKALKEAKRAAPEPVEAGETRWSWREACF